MEQKELVLMIGERYSGRDTYTDRKKSADSILVRLEGRSLHWGCKKIKAGCEGGKKCVVVDDEVCVGMGARKSLIEAGRKAGAKVVKGILVEPVGGEMRRMWEREWLRATTGQLAPRDNPDLDYANPSVTEGFDIIQREVIKLQSPCALNTIGLILDASVLLSGDTLRPGISTLLHAWYTIPSSAKVVIVTLNSINLLQKGSCTDASLPSIIAALRNGLAALKAPYPIYIYASMSVEHPPPSTPDCIQSALQNGYAPCSLSPSDIAYLQRRHFLNTEYLHIVSSTSLLGSGAERLRHLARSIGMRYIDANALLSSVGSGADISEVVRKISEKTKSRINFISQPTTEPSNRYPFLQEAEGGESFVITPRSASTITYHEAIMTHQSASAFCCSLPPPQTGRAIALLEDYVVDYFGTTQTQRGTKFFKKNMVDMVSWDGVEACLCCTSADLSRQYSVSFKITSTTAQLTIEGVNCECEKEMNDGISKCRHAAACAMYLAVHGLPIEDEAEAPEEEDEVEGPPPSEPINMQTSILDHMARMDDRVTKLPELPPPPEPLIKGLIPGVTPKKVGAEDKRTLPTFMRISSPEAGRKTARTTPLRGKGAKKKLYPNAPKRPLTAYFYFLKEARQRVMKENPGVSAAVMSKVLGEMWRETSQDEKERFATMAKEDRARYEEAMKEYKETDEYKNAVPVPDSPVKKAAKKAVKGPAKKRKAEGMEKAVTQDEEASFYAKFQRNSSWRIDGGKWVHEWDDMDEEEAKEQEDGEEEREIQQPRAPTPEPATPPFEPFGTFDEEAETIKKQSTAATTPRCQSTKAKSDLSELNRFTTEKSGLDEARALFFGNPSKKRKT
eukprot:TRINITY_DN30490_c0_g1_i1.p1 TRINITY_DN30490_c0_g1~~TRINITY_DN30490_c0_g1_i1.p1  ORF type:complete len:846 (+),score=204.20 TRINITY_DN30490_c0_g1_i1:69-2606(+)